MKQAWRPAFRARQSVFYSPQLIFVKWKILVGLRQLGWCDLYVVARRFRRAMTEPLL